MAEIIYSKTPHDITESRSGDYYANVYKDDQFVIGIHYKMFSGRSTHEEIIDLKRYTYKPEDGYRIDW
jgi:hypothetical protein